MKICQHCQTQLADDAQFCTVCGSKFASAEGGAPVPPTQPQQQYVPRFDPYDHTGEFDAKDISDNKVIAMLVYLMGVVGIFIALLASSTSPYAAFHVRQALKFTVINALSAIAAALLCWTIIVPVAYGIFAIILFVVKIICFFQVCGGKAKEPAIIREFGFLR